MDFFNETNENSSNITDEENDKKEDFIMVIFVMCLICAFLYFCCLDLCRDIYHVIENCKCPSFSCRRKKNLQKIETDPEINKLYTIENSYFSKYKCPVCFEHNKKHAVLKCKHSFCEECIDKWLEKSKTCPLCREEIL